jgi:hypothetical protein
MANGWRCRFGSLGRVWDRIQKGRRASKRIGARATSNAPRNALVRHRFILDLESLASYMLASPKPPSPSDSALVVQSS